MAGRLVTIATFDNPAKARLAQNALEGAGIKAAVADEAIVQMDWLLGGAVGWVKVQVMEADAERAVAVLEEAFGSDEPVDAATLAAEAEAAGMGLESELPQGPPAAFTPTDPLSAPAPPDEEERPPSERDEYARRFFFAAVFSLVFWPLWFYAVYLFLNAAFGEGAISSRAKRKLLFGGVILVFCSATAYFLFAILLAISRGYF
jgi:hypothetical protein